MTTEKLGDTVSKWWPVILATTLAIIGGAVAWGITTAQIISLASGQTRIEASQEAGHAVIIALSTKVVEYQVKVDQLYNGLMTLQNIVERLDTRQQGQIERLEQRQRDTENKLNILIGRKAVPFIGGTSP
jgi:TolA-binding protein